MSHVHNIRFTINTEQMKYLRLKRRLKHIQKIDLLAVFILETKIHWRLKFISNNNKHINRNA